MYGFLLITLGAGFLVLDFMFGSWFAIPAAILLVLGTEINDAGD